jgi:hypothetical protein
MEPTKLQQILDLIRNRFDLTYEQIAFYSNSNRTAVQKAAKDNHCQRVRGAKKKQAV